MDKMELFEMAEARIHGIVSSDIDKYVKLIADVFHRIPEDDYSELILHRNVHFVLPLNTTAEPVYMPAKSPPGEKMKQGLALIFLIIYDSNFEKMTREEFFYSTAHELAHAYHKHGDFEAGDPGKNPEDIMVKRELEADKQVIKWGFENELKKVPYNYIYGDGFKNWNVNFKKKGG